MGCDRTSVWYWGEHGADDGSGYIVRRIGDSGKTGTDIDIPGNMSPQVDWGKGSRKATRELTAIALLADAFDGDVTRARAIADRFAKAVIARLPFMYFECSRDDVLTMAADIERGQTPTLRCWTIRI